jgi:hypothetical protein
MNNASPSPTGSTALVDHIQVKLLPGLGHLDFIKPQPWWPDCLAWLTRS